MKGTSSSCSNHSETASLNIEGAKGRKDSRRLILALRISFMSARRGSQRMERLPRARGPIPSALEPAKNFAVGDGAQRGSKVRRVVEENDAKVGQVVVSKPRERRSYSISESEKEGPRKAVLKVERFKEESNCGLRIGRFKFRISNFEFRIARALTFILSLRGDGDFNFEYRIADSEVTLFRVSISTFGAAVTIAAAPIVPPASPAAAQRSFF